MQNFAENKPKDFCLVYYSRKKPIHYVAARRWKKCGEAIAHLNESWPTLSGTFFPEGPGALRRVSHGIFFRVFSGLVPWSLPGLSFTNESFV